MNTNTPGRDEPVILSALNDFLYCPRRCALHRLDGLWEANAHTLSGELAHESADDPGYRQYLDSAKGATRIERALPLYCRSLNLVGKGDIVEFHADERAEQITGGAPVPRLAHPGAVPVPVDYKLGPRRKWENDDAQLCAQAMCLEEMFSVAVPRGAVYHVKTRRRREVLFTAELRDLTVRTIADIRAMLESEQLPAANPRPQCEGCSMYATCLPQITQAPDRLDRWHAALFACDPEEEAPGPSQ